jgi:hypothetical protein
LPFQLRLKRSQGFLHERSAEILLILRAKGRIAQRAYDLLGREDPAGSNHLGHERDCAYVGGRYPGLLDLLCERCTATRARPSGRGQDDARNPLRLEAFRDLPAQSFHDFNDARKARGTVEPVVQ